ncbi:MAG TPA: hypothetical protein VIT22_03290 [Pseudoxanthomonas sp.]
MKIAPDGAHIIQPPKPTKIRFRIGPTKTMLFFTGGKSKEMDSAYFGISELMRVRQGDGQYSKISMHFFDKTTLMEVEGKQRRFRFSKPLGPVDDTWEIAFTLFTPNLVADPFPPSKYKTEDVADEVLPWVQYGHVVVMHVYASTKPTNEMPPYGSVRIGPFQRHDGYSCWLCFHEQKLSKAEKRPIEQFRAKNIFDSYTEYYPDYPGSEMTHFIYSSELQSHRPPTVTALVMDKRSVRIHPKSDEPKLA